MYNPRPQARPKFDVVVGVSSSYHLSTPKMLRVIHGDEVGLIMIPRASVLLCLGRCCTLPLYGMHRVYRRGLGTPWTPWADTNPPSTSSFTPETWHTRSAYRCQIFPSTLLCRSNALRY